MDVKKSKSKAIWDNVKTVLFFALSGLLLSYILIEAFLPNSTVKVFGFKPYVVITGSMDPVLKKNNDLIIVTNFEVDKLEPGDIITFNADINFDGEPEVVTHYIFSIVENNQGDYIIRTYSEVSNLDPWVLTEDSILGLYSFKLSGVGAIVLFLQSPFGIAAVLVNIGIIIGIVYILKHGKEPQVIKESEETIEDKKE